MEEAEEEEEEEMKEAGSLLAFFTIAADYTTALQKYATFGRHIFNYDSGIYSITRWLWCLTLILPKWPTPN